MSLTVQKSKTFIITYDCNGQKQTLTVTHQKYAEDVVFQQFVDEIKCLDCGLVTVFAQEEPNLDENWFVPMTGNRRNAHYLKNDKWLCGIKNWVPKPAIRGMLLNVSLPPCKKCKAKLKEAAQQ